MSPEGSFCSVEVVRPVGSRAKVIRSMRCHLIGEGVDVVIVEIALVPSKRNCHKTQEEA